MQLNYTKAASQGIVIETIDNNNNILFEAEYNKAKDAIKDIISQQKKAEYTNKGKETIRVNNRIIFTGQRGTGKTSALLSLKQNLRGNGISGDNDKISFYCLPTVDPSYFDGKNNILTTVLSSMFSNAKHTMEEYEKLGEQKRNEYETLLKDFSKVYKALGQIESSENNQSYTIEKLNDISNASDIHSLMDKLLKDFKKFLDDGGIKFLLVIDDLDMNVACAADMMEQLRKFLSLNDMVILMSANIDQLHYEMCEHYSKAFINTMNDKDQARFIEVEDMASRYLLKLFPTSRRINVEHPISQLLDSNLSIRKEIGADNTIESANKKGKYIIDGGREYQIYNEGEINYIILAEGALQPTILSLIWEKTRLLFVPGKNELHPIIPTNLRELVQFIDVLEDMGKVEYNEHNLFNTINDYRICEDNVSKFKEYFLKTWVPTNLSIEAENIFYSIPEKVDEINKYLINAINVVGSNNKKRLMSREVDLDIIEKNAEGVRIDRDIYTMVSPNDPRFVKANKISDIFNQPSNYSYGDLLLMLDKYETYFESEHDRKFSNAIKIYYSILLFETMFYRSNCVNYYAPEGETDDEKAPNLKDRVNDIIPIQRLIGGTIYYPNYFEIITSKYFKQKGPSYDAKRAFYHKVKEDETDDMPLFSVLYYGDIRPDRYDTKHVYDTTFEHDSEVDSERYKTFDILSIINNMLNPWQTIARAHGSELNIGEWKPKISEWKEYCQCGEKTFPNTILPFYSVDMMLRYIRKTYDVKDIDREYKDEDYANEEKTANWLGLVGYDNNLIDINLVQAVLQRHDIELKKSQETKGKSKQPQKVEDYIIIYDDAQDQFYKLLQKTGIVNKESRINVERVNAFMPELMDIIIKNNFSCVEVNEGIYTIVKEKLNSNIPKLLSILEKEKLVEKRNDDYIIKLETINNSKERDVVREILKELISMRVVECGDKIIVFNDTDQKLANSIKIVIEARKYYKKLTNEVNLKDKKEWTSEDVLTSEDGLACFRDYAISKIMSLYSGGQREQDMLIKNLYRYNSITEMYRYLVDVLWKDAIIEYCIRQEIQKTVHSRAFVKQYYNKLLGVTRDSLDEALDGKKPYNDIEGIYEEIFNHAVKLFIDETAKKS